MNVLGLRYNRLTLLEFTHHLKTSSSSTLEFYVNADTVQNIIGISSTDGDFKRIALKNGSNAYLLNIPIIDETCEDYPVVLQIWGDQAFKYKNRIKKGVILVLTNFIAFRNNEKGFIIRDANVTVLNNSDDINASFPQYHSLINYLSNLHELKERYRCIESEDDLVKHVKCLNNAVGLYHIRITLRFSIEVYEYLNTAINNDKPKITVSVLDINDKYSKLIIFTYDIPKLIKAMQVEMDKEPIRQQFVTVIAHDLEVDSIYQKTVTCLKVTSRSTFVAPNIMQLCNPVGILNCDKRDSHDRVGQSAVGQQSVSTLVAEETEEIIKSPEIISWNDFLKVLKNIDLTFSSDQAASSNCKQHRNGFYSVRCKLFDIIIINENNLTAPIITTTQSSTQNKIINQLVNISLNAHFSSHKHLFKSDCIDDTAVGQKRMTTEDLVEQQSLPTKKTTMTTTSSTCNITTNFDNSVAVAPQQRDEQNEMQLSNSLPFIIKYNPIQFIIGCPSSSSSTVAEVAMKTVPVNDDHRDRDRNHETNNESSHCSESVASSLKFTMSPAFQDTQALDRYFINQNHQQQQQQQHHHHHHSSFTTTTASTAYHQHNNHEYSPSHLKLKLLAGNDCILKIFSNIPADVLVASHLHNKQQHQSEDNSYHHNSFDIEIDHNRRKTTEKLTIFNYEKSVESLYNALKDCAIRNQEFYFHMYILPIADENGILLNENVLFLDGITSC